MFWANLPKEQAPVYVSSKPSTNMTNPIQPALSIQEFVDLCITECVLAYKSTVVARRVSAGQMCVCKGPIQNKSAKFRYVKNLKTSWIK